MGLCYILDMIETQKNDEFLKTYKELKKRNKKPKLLVHVCCGACSIYPLIYLIDLFDITIYFTNSNIFSYEEFEKRLDALENHVNFLNNLFNSDIKIIVSDYDYEKFRVNLLKYKDEKEGGQRCKICIAKRLAETFDFARNNSFDSFSTIMSISRNKDAIYINRIGKEISKGQEKCLFVPFDFKKENGQNIGVKIGGKENVYRQDFCGCEFSLR